MSEIHQRKGAAASAEVPAVTENEAKAEAKAQLLRKKKSSLKGDLMFTLFLIFYGASTYASFKGLIPWQKWEIYSLAELVVWAELMRDHVWIPILLSALYIIFCFGGQAILKNRKGWDKELRLPLAWWSLFLAVFSFVGRYPIAVSA